MKSKKIRYTADSNLHRFFGKLVVVWGIFGGVLIFLLMINVLYEPITIKEKIVFLMYYLIVEVLSVITYFLFKNRRKEFVKYKTYMISAGLKTSGKICKVRREYEQPDNGNERVPSFYYAEIEYFDNFHNAYVKCWTKGLRGVPYGEENYREEVSNRYETIYVPKTSLLCTVYYLTTGEFFVE